MKKLYTALLAMLLILSGSAYAYEFTVINETDGQLKAYVNYGGAGVCAPDQYVINPRKTMTASGYSDVGGSHTKQTYGCCLENVRFTSTSGKSAGYTFNYYPATTGFGISCKDSVVRVRQAADNSLYAQ